MTATPVQSTKVFLGNFVSLPELGYTRLIMKVALDATPLTEPTGGIRRYTIQLANALARSFPER